MDTKDIITLLSVLFGGIALLCSVIRERQRTAIELLKLDLQKLEKFLDTPGLADLVKFFDGKRPQEVANALAQSIDAAEKLKLVVAQYGSLVKALAVMKLDEPTFKIHQLIESNEKLYSRFQVHRPSKAFLRKHITTEPKVRESIREHKSIFIESGSTLAYVALAISDGLSELRHDYDVKPIRICTNNIIVYVLLLFAKHVEPVLLPGHPSNAYGATFGNRHESDVCDDEAVMKFLEANEVSVLFTTASVLDLRYGPHVSSPANHKIKRVLLEYARRKECLNFLILAAENINNDVSDGKALSKECKLIFDTNGDYKIPESRERAESGWREFMASDKNFVITGSANRACAQTVRDGLIHGRTEYVDNAIPFADGELVSVQGGRPRLA